MRRRISLYIAGHRVDLSDESFILFNYTMEDLSNPTIVKNSFSQQISLKGTPTNNQVFGDFFRVDRKVDYNSSEVGPGFNPSKKTPFAIYNELDEILESGYCKLDEVEKDGEDVTYKISLYGGLGSFLFSLSYDEAGNKRTLADLDFLAYSCSSSWILICGRSSPTETLWSSPPGYLPFSVAQSTLPSVSATASRIILAKILSFILIAPNGAVLSRDIVFLLSGL